MIVLLLVGCGALEPPPPPPPNPVGGHRDDVWAGMLGIAPVRYWMMGCPDATDLDCRADEVPVHNVELDVFDIDGLEVTQSAYSACGDCTKPEGFDPDHRGDFPVTNVTWAQAGYYCSTMGKRLPTEAEWERAAGGNTSWLFPWEGPPNCSKANYADCWLANTPEAIPVGTFDPGPEGAFDMAGNAFEWVADWYDETYYQTGVDTDDVGMGWVNPAGPEGAGLMHRVVRGGAFVSEGSSLYNFRRFHWYPESPSPTIGFRCARTPTII